LPRTRARSLPRIALGVAREPMFAMLLVAGGIYALLGDLQEANGKGAEAAVTHQKGLDDPSATAQEIHNYARGLQGQGKKDEAVRVFLFNAKRFPNQWPVQVGLVRAYSAQGKFADAIRAAKAGITAAPNDGAKRNLQAMLAKLEKNEDVN